MSQVRQKTRGFVDSFVNPLFLLCFYVFHAHANRQFPHVFPFSAVDAFLFTYSFISIYLIDLKRNINIKAGK
jgi:hypothetical protein